MFQLTKNEWKELVAKCDQLPKNIKRFPHDFMFQLTTEEWQNLISQFATSSWGGTRKLPFAFTELIMDSVVAKFAYTATDEKVYQSKQYVNQYDYLNFQERNLRL